MNFLITSKQLEQEIFKIQETSATQILAYSRIVKYCREILEMYRGKIKTFKFKSVFEEIQFFKEKKQIPLNQLIFYINLRSVELESTASVKYRRKMLSKKIKKINKFFQKNREFQIYVDLGHTFLDNFYYTREFQDKVESNDTPLYWDPEFSTSHDFLLAQLRV